MPALNFKARFAETVSRGYKRQTIRAARKDGRPSATPGADLYLYTGMRTKACRLLGTAPCTRVRLIRIDEDSVTLDDRVLSADETSALARADGLADTAEFLAFFQKLHGLPFTGCLIEWGEIKTKAQAVDHQV